ncbi:MAG TPA: hypothetical protein PLA54_10790 [Spirochaetota bacterium]|nr:hypothetical protein [Spirochaetota bacterium]HQE59664.1 hypothetical protein [Spirochaetota bacterium]
MIETTLNISLESYNKIIKFSSLNNIRIKKIINYVLQECLKNQILQKKDANLFKAVRYQKKKHTDQEWKIFHASIPDSLYESCMDYRRLYKVSVSSVLEWGLEYFLEIVIENILCNDNSISRTDNYHIEFNLKTFFDVNFTKLSYYGTIIIKTG